MSGRRIELSGTQVASSVLAAVTGAIVASSLGVAGTVIGVAVVSFATTAGSAVYRHYLGRTQERLRSAAAAMGHLATTSAPTRTGNGRASAPPARDQSTAQDHDALAEPARTRSLREGSLRKTGQATPAAQAPGRAATSEATSQEPASGAGAPSAGGPAAGMPGAGGPGAGMPGAGGPGAGRPGASAPGETAPRHTVPGTDWSSAQPGGPLHETWIIPAQEIRQAQADAEGASAANSRPSQTGTGPDATLATDRPADATLAQVHSADATLATDRPADGTAAGHEAGGQPSGGVPAGGTPGSGTPGTAQLGTAQPGSTQPGTAELGSAGPASAELDGGGAEGTGGPGTAAGDGAAGRPGLVGVMRGLAATRWVKLAGVAVMIFVLAMGGITILEAVTGKPLDALIWGAHSSGTTVGNVVNGSSHRSRQTPAKPAGTPTPRPTSVHHTPTPTPTAPTPTPAPSTTVPSPTPTPTPTATPSSGASRAPATPSSGQSG